MKSTTSYIPIGTSLGISFGLLFGAALDNIAIGMLWGVALGPSLGIALGHLSRKKPSDRPESAPGFRQDNQKNAENRNDGGI